MGMNRSFSLIAFKDGEDVLGLQFSTQEEAEKRARKLFKAERFDSISVFSPEGIRVINFTTRVF